MKIKVLDYGYKHLPRRAHYNDAGADVYCIGNYTLNPGDVAKIPLGFGLDLPDGMMALVMPRSSLSSKGITCELPPIDSGYSGEIHAIVTNNSNKKVQIIEDERIGQIVIMPVYTPDFALELGKNRGSGAFGSTN